MAISSTGNTSEATMALEIRSEQIDRLAQELAEVTGESVEDTVGRAICERLERVRPPVPSLEVPERRKQAEQILRDARAANVAARAADLAAKLRGEPLLFKGGGFARTDVVPALAP
jgi:hypothetical protein